MVVSMTALSCFLLKSLKYLIKDGYFSLNLSFAKVKVVRKEEESISPKIGRSEAHRNVLEKTGQANSEEPEKHYLVQLLLNKVKLVSVILI